MREEDEEKIIFCDEEGAFLKGTVSCPLLQVSAIEMSDLS